MWSKSSLSEELKKLKFTEEEISLVLKDTTPDYLWADTKIYSIADRENKFSQKSRIDGKAGKIRYSEKSWPRE